MLVFLGLIKPGQSFITSTLTVSCKVNQILPVPEDIRSLPVYKSFLPLLSFSKINLLMPWKAFSLALELLLYGSHLLTQRYWMVEGFVNQFSIICL